MHLVVSLLGIFILTDILCSTNNIKCLVLDSFKYLCHEVAFDERENGELISLSLIAGLMLTSCSSCVMTRHEYQPKL